MTIDAEKPKARRHRDKVEAFHSPLPVRQFGRTQPSQLAVPVVKWLQFSPHRRGWAIALCRFRFLYLRLRGGQSFGGIGGMTFISSSVRAPDALPGGSAVTSLWLPITLRLPSFTWLRCPNCRAMSRYRLSLIVWLALPCRIFDFTADNRRPLLIHVKTRQPFV
jgi:hypothetical protein